MRFLIAVQDLSGRWQKKGIVKMKSRCVPDADVKSFFPPKTRAYEDVLKSCRFLAAEPAAEFVDWKSKNRSYMIRTVKIKD